MDDLNHPATVEFYRRNLPHWMVTKRPYFVTLRENGSLPVEVLRRLEVERTQLQRKAPTSAQVLALQRKHFVDIERVLDNANASNWHLNRPECAKVVLDSLTWLETNLKWTIHAATIMPNHVHIVMQNQEDREAFLAEDIGRSKSFTGLSINRLLGRHGKFWQEEMFDRWIRDEAKFWCAIHYVINNPVAAGLIKSASDWPYLVLGDWVRSELASRSPGILPGT